MMKKYPFLVLFFVVFASAQTYHFDNFIYYKTERFEEILTLENYNFFYNSKNKSISLSVIAKGNKKIAMLFDDNTKIKHVYTVIEKDNQLNFFYKHSSKLPDFKILPKEEDDVIEVTKIDSLKFIAIVYENKKKKKKIRNIKLELIPSDFNKINVGADYSRSEEIDLALEKLLPQNKTFIISIKESYNKFNKLVGKTTLEELIKVDLSISVPQNLIWKEYDYWKDFD